MARLICAGCGELEEDCTCPPCDRREECARLESALRELVEAHDDRCASLHDLALSPKGDSLHEGMNDLFQQADSRWVVALETARAELGDSKGGGK